MLAATLCDAVWLLVRCQLKEVAPCNSLLQSQLAWRDDSQLMES